MDNWNFLGHCIDRNIIYLFPKYIHGYYVCSILTSPIDLIAGIPIVVVTPQEQYQDPRIPDLFLWIVVIFIVHLGIKNSVSSPPSLFFFSPFPL